MKPTIIYKYNLHYRFAKIDNFKESIEKEVSLYETFYHRNRFEGRREFSETLNQIDFGDLLN